MTAMALNDDDGDVPVPVQVRWDPLLHARVAEFARRMRMTRTAAYNLLVERGLDSFGPGGSDA